MSSKKKIVAVVFTTVALSVGTVGVANASGSHGKFVSHKQSSARTTFNAMGNPMAGQKMDKREAEVKSVLAGLVTKGTITQAQADAIIAALTAAHAAKEGMHDSNDVAKDARRDARVALIATTLGIDAATIKTRLEAGETLGAIAGAKKPALIITLVAEATKEIDANVVSGKLTAAQATTMKADLTTRITAQVDSVHGAMGQFEGKKMGEFKGKKH